MNHILSLIYNRLYITFFYLALAAIVFGVAFFSFNLYSYDLRVPFSYSGDSVVILMYIKGLIQDGWPTTITHLSAPFTYSGAAFPLLTSVDWFFIKILSIFTDEPGYLLNGFWLLSMVFSAWTATYAGYQLGLTRIFSFLGGVLYAFLPFALLRNVAHLNLAYYFVPLLCLLGVIIAGSGIGIRQLKHATMIGLIACVLQGFNYVYYSFFAVLLFVVAAMISFKRGGGFAQIKLPALAIAIIILSTAINMIPAMQSWQKNGVPPEMNYKYDAESEIYGAKLRRMLIPHPENFFPPLAKIAQKDLNANFPNENENITARMGLYGAFGLLLILLGSIMQGFRNSSIKLRSAITGLGLATFLIITVGGFGTVINLLTVPDVRGYNRFSVFLAFFSIIITSLWLQDRLNKRTHWKVAIYFITAVFVIFSLYDQLLDKKKLVTAQLNDTKRAIEERLVVEKLETFFQSDSAILELPFTGYPPLANFNKMKSYDHVRPFLWSHHLKWSWPSFSQRHRQWQNRMATLTGNDLINGAIYSGFSAIWIDRSAYTDNGQELIASLKIGKVKQVNLYSNNIVVLDIRDVAKDLKANLTKDEFRKNKSYILGNDLLIGWELGFYDLEKDPEGHEFRWVQNKSKLVLKNSGNTTLSGCITFNMSSNENGIVRIEISDLTLTNNLKGIPQINRIPYKLEPGKAIKLNFKAEMNRVIAPSDPRNLFFKISDFDVKVDEHIAISGDSCALSK